MSAKRRGMLIKNTNDKPVEVAMASRTLKLKPGEETLITSEEVRDTILRDSLQIRSITIVRPATIDEEAQLRKELEEQQRT